MLVSRREMYRHPTGLHKMYVNIGGSHGHGGTYAVDIDEGRVNDCPILGPAQGRNWEVNVTESVDHLPVRVSPEEDLMDVVQDHIFERKLMEGEDIQFTANSVCKTLGKNHTKVAEVLEALTDQGALLRMPTKRGAIYRPGEDLDED